MLAAKLYDFGATSEVLKVENVVPAALAPGEILLDMLAAPVNPADINIIEGKYGELPELPSTIGNEGVGRVAKIAEGVSGFQPGDMVLPRINGTWCQQMIVKSHEAILLPIGLDPQQASMLSVNPCTAWGMLHHHVALKAGDWIVQNAANSAAGRCVIQIAAALGFRTVNVVRREELVPELEALGGDVVVTEECDLRKEIESLCSGQRPRLALNAVGGASALNLANALEDRGVIVTYGAMGRQPLKIPNGLLIFRNLRFEGFWLKKWLLLQSPESLGKIIHELASLSLSGKLRLPVQQVFPLSEVATALEQAALDKRSGKVLLDLTR